MERGTRQSSLRDCDTLALSTGNTPDKLIADLPRLSISRDGKQCGGVTNLCVDGMRDSKHGHHNIAQVVGERVPVETLGQFARLTCTRSESEGVADTQLGKVNINFGGVDSFTSVVTVHLFGGHTWKENVSQSQSNITTAAILEAVPSRLRSQHIGDFAGLLTMIVEVRVIIVVETVHLACNSLEEGRTAGSRRTQHDEHLALLDHTIEPAQDIDPLFIAS